MRALLELPLRVLSHNIRYATTSPFKGEELWTVRAPRVVNELVANTRFNAEAFIGLQEVLNGQLKDIMIGLNSPSSSPVTTKSILVQSGDEEIQGPSLSTEPEWSYIGVGRDDGKQTGEYSPILYRARAWKLLEFKSTWISDTPNIPSKFPGAGSIRILTSGVFEHRTSSRKVLVLNTHLDDQSSAARALGGRIVLAKIEEVRKAWKDKSSGADLPVLLTGDFNSEVGQEAYTILTGGNSSVFDVRDRVAEKRRYGDINTFTGFGSDKPTRIDFIFASKTGGWTIDGYGVLENRFEDGVYASDHRTVVGDFTLRS